MTQTEKLLQRFFEAPESLKYRELEKVLFIKGFVKIEIKGGSHVKFKHIKLEKDLIIPVHNNDCKPFYKKEALRKIKTIN